MLRSGATAIEKEIDIRAVADPEIESRLPGGRQLALLGRAGGRINTPDSSAAEAVAAELGQQAATDAAAVATAFEGLNRIVDGVGLPVGRASMRDNADIIEMLGLDKFPHANHS